eukprot:Skav203039  [mRNA]  locus=scaffold583:621631:624454:+ [translate_table: standard]
MRLPAGYCWDTGHQDVKPPATEGHPGSLAKGSQSSLALDLLQQMPRKQVTPNVISYSSAISAFAKGGDWQMALDLLQEMQTAATPPNVISYNAAISACEKGKHWEMALRLEWSPCANPWDALAKKKAYSPRPATNILERLDAVSSQIMVTLVQNLFMQNFPH